MWKQLKNQIDLTLPVFNNSTDLVKVNKRQKTFYCSIEAMK